ncbi:hypothetical protein AB0G05_11390 [Nonomuraea wenchangensis]
MSALPAPRAEDIADFDVTWDDERSVWVGKHLYSNKTIEAPDLRALELEACAQRIVHEWRKVGL